MVVVLVVSRPGIRRDYSVFLLFYHQIVNVETMRVALDETGIESQPLWKPMHLQPVYAGNPRYVNGVSEELFRCGLCLPSGPYVPDEDIAYIVEEIKTLIRR